MITLSSGVILSEIDHGGEPRPLATDVARWLRSLSTETIIIEVDRARKDELLAFAKTFAAKVLR